MEKSLFRQQAAALIVVMMVLSTLIGVSICALLYTSSVAKNVQRSNNYRQEMDIGDGALELAFDYWRATCRLKANISRPGERFFRPAAADGGHVQQHPRLPGADARRSPISTPTSPSPTTRSRRSTRSTGRSIRAVAPPQATGMSIGANQHLLQSQCGCLAADPRAAHAR